MMVFSSSLGYHIYNTYRFDEFFLEVYVGSFFAFQTECIELANQCKVILHENHIELLFDNMKLFIHSDAENKYKFKIENHDDTPLNLDINTAYQSLKNKYPNQNEFSFELYQYKLIPIKNL